MKIEHRLFTKEQDEFLSSNINKFFTIYDLTDAFNERFPEHSTNYKNIQKRMQKLGIKKATHNIRKEKRHSINPLETVIKSPGRTARVKTENGYVSANKYFKNKYFPGQEGKIIHLNGDYGDFSRDNLCLVSSSIFSSLHWRKWIFNDPDLTKTAILTAQLLEFFPEYSHNENQYLRMKRFEREN